ncbi:hypothetical protein DFJ63DRAFT_311511 [Scheffersomyces coipomensis]|uniref:uncharacterized protein n=1 Tax=Scheffersomyces coipomensis TaxID=1788519 RepID=UPI00315CDB04
MDIKSTMVYNTLFLTKYFVSLPNDIIIDIIHLLPPRLIECLMNTNAFDLGVYDEFLKHSIVCKENICDTYMSIGSMLDKPYESFSYVKLDITLSQWPLNFRPRSIHIHGDHRDLVRYISSNHAFISFIEDVRISVRMNYGHSRGTIISPKLFEIPNLKSLEIQYHFGCTGFINIPFEINHKCDLLDLKQFLKKLGRCKNINDVLQNLPTTIDSFTINGINKLATRFTHLINLKSLSVTNSNIDSLIYLPYSLENLTCFGSQFKEMKDVRWPSNLKTIDMEASGIIYDDVVTLSNWPIGLISLTFKQNYTHYIISDLPESLQYLELTPIRYDSYIQIRSQSLFGEHYTFPESLIEVKISCIHFSNFVDRPMEFPKRLERLEITSSSIALDDCIFPTTLTYLDLSYTTINSLEAYNSEFKDWNQLVNLKYLNLKGSSLKQYGLKNWLPPRSLNILDLSSTNIRSLDIPMFKELNKEYTKNLTEIDVSKTGIVRIPQNFYLPENVDQFHISESRLNPSLLPVTILNKKFTKIISPLLPPLHKLYNPYLI